MSKTNKIDIVIIGAGFAGVGAGIKLKEAGITSFKIFEKGAEIGGTWRDNTYPGCACDIPSFLYSYSFEPNPNWSRSFSPHDEILNYIKHCVKKYEIESHIQLQTEIKEARFDETTGSWTILDNSGNKYTANVIISAPGPLNRPLYPKVNGIDNFKGESFHSMFWNHDYDFTGKKVAVIGTGASAIQFIPEIAKEVEHLTVFQRTPPWIQAKDNKRISDKSKKTFQRFPWYQKFWRELIYWFLEYRGLSQYADNKVRANRKKRSLEHLHNSISDKALIEKLTPNYEIGCKRVLLSDNYYPTLERENVTLETNATKEITANGIVDGTGKLHEVDAIIYGTGFHTTTYQHLYSVYGLDNKSLFDEWNEKGAEAYYGITSNGFPNLLHMVGPNTGLGHNSIIHMMESQLSYILDYIKKLQKLPGKTLDVKSEVQERFNIKTQEELSKMIWSSGGCSSYYLRNNDGKNTSIWPGTTMSYRKQTRKINLKDYQILENKKSKLKPSKTPVAS